MNENKLKRCPFCGNEPIIQEISTFDIQGTELNKHFKIGCGRCGIYFTKFSPEDVMREWNRRSDDKEH